MPYTIPNEATAAFTDQAELDSRDFEILTAAISHGTGASTYGLGPTGVEFGCAVTAQGAPDMTVAVATGNVRIGGRLVKVAAGNVTITAADGTNPRFDLIVVDTAGAKTAIAGTAAANAVFPTITAGRVVLAAVYVPANDTAINTNQITDKRVMIDEPPFENVKWYGAKGDDSTNDAVALQAAIDAAYDTSLSYGRARTVFFPRGLYRTATALTLHGGIRLQGVGKPSLDGRYGSWIVGTTSSMTILDFPEPGTCEQNGFTISGIGVYANPGITGVTGISIIDMNRWLIENCAFEGGDTTAMAIGMFLRVGNEDHNWNNLVNTDFYKVVVCIDSYGITGLSVRGCHFLGAVGITSFIGIITRADASGTTQNVRIVDSEFIVTEGGIGIHIQGVHHKVVACTLEAITGSTTAVGIKIERPAGATTNSGRRNELLGLMLDKFNVGIQILVNSSQNSILGVGFVSCTTNFSDAGTETQYIPNTTGEIAKFAVGFDLPSVTAPASPGSGYSRLYVDTADQILKSKDAAGVVSIYGARTRSYFIDASVLRMDSSSGVKLGTPPNAVDGVALLDGITTGAYGNFIMPVDVITGTVTVRPIWVPSATDAVAHTVRWQMNIRIISAADVTAAGTSVAWTGVSAARTVNVEVMETGQVSTGVSPAANDRMRLEIQRVGGDAADTYVGDVYLIGVRLDYQANN